MKDNLIYPVADSLGIPMHEMSDGKVRAADTRTITFGGMKLEAEMIVVSDVITDSQAGYFVKLFNNLWLYMVVSDLGKGLSDLLAYSFDSNVVDLTVKDLPAFGGKSIQATMKRLQPAIREQFKFSANGKHWTTTDVPDLDYAE
jgi:hypothetical protein